MGVLDKMDSCGYFGGGPPPTRDNNYLSPIHVYPDKSHITFYHGGRPCYFGHHHRTEAPSTTKARNYPPRLDTALRACAFAAGKKVSKAQSASAF